MVWRGGGRGALAAPIPRLSELERPRYGVFVPLVPVALAHTAVKNEEVGQTGAVGGLAMVTEQTCEAPREGRSLRVAGL